jgi:hypothetical protein
MHREKTRPHFAEQHLSSLAKDKLRKAYFSGAGFGRATLSEDIKERTHAIDSVARRITLRSSKGAL